MLGKEGGQQLAAVTSLFRATKGFQIEAARTSATLGSQFASIRRLLCWVVTTRARDLVFCHHHHVRVMTPDGRTVTATARSWVDFYDTSGSFFSSVTTVVSQR